MTLTDCKSENRRRKGFGISMKSSLDSVVYLNGKVTCTGWAAPETPGDEVCLSIRKEDGTVLDVQASKNKRADVGEVIYQDASFDMYGLTFSFEPGEMINCYAVFTSKEHPEDTLEVLIDCPGLWAAYCYQHSIKGKLRRLQRSKSLKDFRLEEKYLDLEPEEKKYAIWQEKQVPGFAERLKEKTARFALHPKFSIIVPLYHTPLNFLDDMIDSVKKQTYENWELCLANGSPEDEALDAQVHKHMSNEPRIKYVKLKENLGIAGNTNAALELATGSYTALLDHDDFLAPNALFEFVKAINENGDADCLYSDEDKVDQEGKLHYFPHFKSDYNPDLLHTNNYICHFFAVKTSIIQKVGDFRSNFDGAQDFDLVLRCIDESESVVHVAKVLYHWRCHKGSTSANTDSKTYAFEAGKRALQEYYDRHGIEAKVETTSLPGYYKTKYLYTDRPLVTVIIPNKDHIEDLERCVKSLLAQKEYTNLEILIIENNSEKPETFAYYETLKKQDNRIRVETWKMDDDRHSEKHGFNYAAIQNFAAQKANGEYLLLLNNDTEVIDPDFLVSMVGYAKRKEVGAVGAKLLYENDTVQHAGVIVGVEGVAFHQFLEYPQHDPGYMGRASFSQDVSAVTGACLLIRKEVYEEVGGMDEHLAVSYNDVDLCLKLREKGYLVVYDAFAHLHHYESRSRGYEDSPKKQARLAREAEYMKNKWKHVMGTDPYYNKNLSLKNGYYKLP